MMQQIGDEMQEATGAFCRPTSCSENDKVAVLDLCMAPGGYTATALKYNLDARAIGITLPPEKGGHEVFLNSPRSKVVYHDLTLFAKEFGAEEVPSTHPEHVAFSMERPFADQRFDLLMCDGQVLRTHTRHECREYNEPTRLTISQLILALQRIRHGGTMIVLLHNIEALNTMELLYLFSEFSAVQLFKPAKKHAIRSTFYLIAKNVQPDTEAAREAVGKWKSEWWNATFDGEAGIGAQRIRLDDEYVRGIIDEFGEKFRELARPIWSIQAEALSKTEFTQ